MVAGKRFVALMVAALALGAAPQPNGNRSGEKAQAKQEPAQRSTPTPPSPAHPVKILDSSILTQPCDPGEDRRQSDLCAQWKAADAASGAAMWAMIGTIVAAIGTIGLYWQIKLTREAVRDTGDATKAMQRQNELTDESRRAWVRLDAKPQLVKLDGADGLYMRIDFIAENVGNSPATHFDIQHTVLFDGEKEAPLDFFARIKEQVAKWKKSHKSGPKSVLAPNDPQIGGIWESYTASEIGWRHSPGFKTAHPVLLSAVIYRTVSAPNTIQCSYRTWYLVQIKKDGERLSCIVEPTQRLGPTELGVETMMGSMAHEEYPANGDTK